MALPKLNNTPKYSVVIPSTQQQVRFRPYLVKEEKILMLAMESKDDKQILNTIVDTIISCIEEPINRRSLTTFDVEYLFIQIRSKSVGETSKVLINCSECKSPNEVNVKIDEIKVDVPDVKNVIELSDNISLKMRWPVYDAVINEVDPESTSLVDQTFQLILHCIDSVMTDDELIKMTDVTKEEKMEFIESFSSDQFAKIREYVETVPKLTHKVKFACKECKHKNEMTLEGVNDFF